MNGSVEEARQQTNDKPYAQPFEADKRKLFKTCVNFRAKNRHIEKWIRETAKQTL